jgi:two-component system, chemotaxis family, sensor histidine kinase and response regulator PixL
MPVNPDIHDQAYQFFIEEVPELLQIIEDGILQLRLDRSAASVHAVMRAAHSIKGGSASVELEAIKDISHRLETAFRALYDETLTITVELESLLLQAYDCLQRPLNEQMDTGNHDEEAALAAAEPIFQVLEAMLGDSLGKADGYIPSSSDLGIDMVNSIFEVDVMQGIDRLKEVLADPANNPVVGEIQAQAEVFLGFGELLDLPGFGEIAQLILTAVEHHTDSAMALLEVAIADLSAATAIVLAGDRQRGGEPSEELRRLAEGGMDLNSWDNPMDSASFSAAAMDFQSIDLQSMDLQSMDLQSMDLNGTMSAIDSEALGELFGAPSAPLDWAAMSMAEMSMNEMSMADGFAELLNAQSLADAPSVPGRDGDILGPIVDTQTAPAFDDLAQVDLSTIDVLDASNELFGLNSGLNNGLNNLDLAGFNGGPIDGRSSDWLTDLALSEEAANAAAEFGAAIEQPVDLDSVALGDSDRAIAELTMANLELADLAQSDLNLAEINLADLSPADASSAAADRFDLASVDLAALGLEGAATESIDSFVLESLSLDDPALAQVAIDPPSMDSLGQLDLAHMDFPEEATPSASEIFGSDVIGQGLIGSAIVGQNPDPWTESTGWSNDFDQPKLDEPGLLDGAATDLSSQDLAIVDLDRATLDAPSLDELDRVELGDSAESLNFMDALTEDAFIADGDLPAEFALADELVEADLPDLDGAIAAVELSPVESSPIESSPIQSSFYDEASFDPEATAVLEMMDVGLAEISPEERALDAIDLGALDVDAEDTILLDLPAVGLAGQPEASMLEELATEELAIEEPVRIAPVPLPAFLTSAAFAAASAEMSAEITEFKGSELEVAEPEVTESEVPELDVSELDVSEPEVIGSEVAELNVAELSVAEPEVTEPEVAELDVAELEAAELDRSIESAPSMLVDPFAEGPSDSLVDPFAEPVAGNLDELFPAERQPIEALVDPFANESAASDLDQIFATEVPAIEPAMAQLVDPFANGLSDSLVDPFASDAAPSDEMLDLFGEQPVGEQPAGAIEALAEVEEPIAAVAEPAVAEPEDSAIAAASDSSPIEEPDLMSLFDPAMLQPMAAATVAAVGMAAIAAEPQVEPVAESVVEPAIEPAIEPIVEPVIESIVEPVIESIVEPIVEPQIEPVAESVVEPIVEPIFEPKVEPVVESLPVVEPQPVAESVVEPAIEPTIEATATPVIAPVTAPVAVPAIPTAATIASNANHNAQQLFDQLPGVEDMAAAAALFQMGKAAGAPEPKAVETVVAKAPADKNADKGNANLSVKVDLSRLDRMNNLVGELVLSRNGLSLQQEQMLRINRELGRRLTHFQELVGRLRGISDQMILTPGQSNAPSPNLAPTTSLLDGFDALEMDRYSHLHTQLQELFEETMQLEESVSDIGYSTEQSQQTLTQQRQILSQLQTELMWARMLPLDNVLSRFPRLLRDLSAKYGKQINLKLEGTGVLVDKGVLEKLYDPLLHLLRNAFDHGIEMPEVRRQSGKPEQGTIEIRAYYRGNQTVIELRDDGKGLDARKIARRAIELGWLSKDEVNSIQPSQLYEFIFEPGFSTASQVSELSGRGVGLDVVRGQIKELKGNVVINSTPGKGSSFILQLPLTLSIARLLICQIGSSTIGIPADTIEDMLSPQAKQVKIHGNKRFLFWREDLLPIYSASKLMNYSCPVPEGVISKDLGAVPVPADWAPPLIIMRNGDEYFALEVDRLLTEQELVIKPFASVMAAPEYLYGCTILGDGRMVPILDGIALIDQVVNKKSASDGFSNIEMQNTIAGMGLAASLDEDDEPAAPAALGLPQLTRKTVLVVDDSTALRRTLALSLEKAGFRVLQAGDGQEALTQLRQNLDSISLVVSDVEMPNMNGFEFLTQRRRDPKLLAVPVVMLTSRSNDKHRRLATQLNANGYFSKPYVEQEFLKAIGDMVNQPAMATV